MRTSLIAAASIALAAPALADSYRFDPAHTEVMASWNHLGLSTQTLEFLAVDGEVVFDQADIGASRVTVTIPVESVHTGLPAFDEHLTGGDFFDLDAYPEITFVSTGARQTGDATGRVDGELSIKGVTRPVTLDVVFNFAGPHPLDGVVPAYNGVEAAGFTATAEVKRSDFGLGRFAPAVSDDIRIVINTELQKN